MFETPREAMRHISDYLDNPVDLSYAALKFDNAIPRIIQEIL